MATFFKSIQKSIRYWYLPAVIGVFFVIFGIYIFSTPIATYAVLTYLFSVSFIIAGVMESYFSVSNRDTLEGWGWYLTSGIASLVLGILLLIQPETSALVLPFFVGITLLFRSFQGLGFAFELKKYGQLNWGNLAIVSILGIVCSVLLIANPIFTGLSIVVFTGLSFIFGGISGIILSVQLKKLKSLPSQVSDELKSKIESLRKEYHDFIADKKNYDTGKETD